MKPYFLSNVEDDAFLDKGCYGSVSFVRINGGVKCIAKRLHDILIGYGVHESIDGQQKQSIKDKFRDECIYLSRMRHPNIVQFMGIHCKDDRLSLIMEFLPMSVKKCIERCNNERFIIPTSCKLAILRDVSYGLLHLHNLSIAHRDLSAQNVLLTSDLRAKIADLGVSRILTPLEQRRLTKAPGASDIMPPEALEEDCLYTWQIDIFSFGVMALYLIVQEYPNVSNSGISREHLANEEIEVGKRLRHIHQVPRFCRGAVSIIRACLRDVPERRPQASGLKEKFEYLCNENPNFYGDTIKMLQTIKQLVSFATCCAVTTPMHVATRASTLKPVNQ